MISGRRSCWVGLAVLAAALPVPDSSAGARPRFWHCHHCRGGPPSLGPYDDGFFPPFIYEEPPPSGYPPILNDPEDEPPLVVEPSPRPQNLPYTEGFVLDVSTPTVDDDLPPQKLTTVLNRYRQVADTLAQCWSPPVTFDDRRWEQVTLRVSFRRDGTINGLPRIPHAAEGLTQAARSDLTQSLTSALRRCTPLTFSPALGAAVAGQIFAIRFIQQDPQP